MKWRKATAALLALVMTLQSIPALAAEPEKSREEIVVEKDDQLLKRPRNVPSSQSVQSASQRLTASNRSYMPAYKPYPTATYELISMEEADGTLTILDMLGKASGELRLPESIDGKVVAKIGANAFDGGKGFTGSLIIPSGVTSIGADAFYNCSGLTGCITIPKSVTNIEEGAFARCGGSKIIVSPENPSYKSQDGLLLSKNGEAVLACPTGKSGEWSLPLGVTRIEGWAFDGCRGFTGNLSIPNGVTKIGICAFQGCNNFDGSVTIPNSVEAIEPVAFNCCGCNEFVVASENNFYQSQDGLLLTKDGSCVLSAPYRKTGSLVIPKSVTKIEEGSFASCSGFTGDLVLPSGITSIGEYAFVACTGFTGHLIIPAGVTSIERGAFSQCYGLDGVYFRGNAPLIGSYNSFEPDIVLYHSLGTTGWTDSPDYDAAAGTWKGYKLQIWNGGIDKEVQLPESRYGIQVVTDQGVPIAGAAVSWNEQQQITNQDGLAFFPRLTAGTPLITVKKGGFLDWSNAGSSWGKNENRYDTVILYPAADSSCKLAEARYSNAASMNPSVDLLTKTKKISLGIDLLATGSVNAGKFYLQCAAVTPTQAQCYSLFQKNKLIATSADGAFTLRTDQFTEGGQCSIRVTAADGTEVDTSINLIFTEDHINETSEIRLSGNAIQFHVSDNVPYLGGSDFKFSLPLNIPVQAAVDENFKIMLGFNLNLQGGDSNKKMMEDAKKTLSELQQLNSYDLNHMSKKDLNGLRSLVKSRNHMDFFKKGTVDFIGYAELDTGSSVASGQIALLAAIDPVKFGFNTVVVVVPVTVQVGLAVGANAVGEIKYDWKNATFLGGLRVSPHGELKAFGGVGVGSVVGVGAYGSAALDADVQVIGTNPGLQRVDLTGALGLKAYAASFEKERPFAYNTWHLYTANSVRTMAAEEPGAQLFDASAYVPMDLDYLSEQGAWMGSEAQLSAADAKMQLQVLQEQVFRNARPVMTEGPDGLYAAFVQADAKAKTPCVHLSSYQGSTWSQPVAVHTDAVLDGSPALFFDGTVLHLAYTQTKPDFDRSSLLSVAQNQQLVVGTIDPDTLAFTVEQTYEGGFLQVPQFVDQNGTPALVWLDSTVTSVNDVLFAPSGRISYAEYADSWSPAKVLCTVDQAVLSMTPGYPEGTLGAACVLDTDGNPQTEADRAIYSLNGSSQTLLSANCRGSVTWDLLPGAAKPAFLWNNGNLLCSSLGTELTVPGLSADYQILGNRLYYSAPSQDAANLTVMTFENSHWSAPIALTEDIRYLENISMAAWDNQDHVLGLSTFATITESNVDDAKNLVFGSILPVSDLILDDLSFDAEGISAGAAVPVTAAVINGSDHAITSVDIFVDGVKQRTEACSILPGEMAELTLNLTCPSAATSFEISVRETGRKDYTIENNQKSLLIGTPDVSVEAEYEQIGGKRSVVAVLQNNGVSPASGTVQFLTADKEVLTESLYEDLMPGEVRLLSWNLDEDKLHYVPCDIDIQAVCSTVDAAAYDNAVSIFLPARETPAEISSVIQKDAQIFVELSEAAPGLTVLCALYDGNDRMVGLQTAPANQQALTFQTEHAAGARVFLINESSHPFCKAIGIAIS